MTDIGHAILAHAVDYAGLFPPAALGMEEAARAFAAYRLSPDAWALGRFVVQASRLSEFVVAARQSWPRAASWELSVLVAAVEPDLGRLAAVEAETEGRAVVRAVEGKASTVPEVDAHAAFVAAGYETYVEIGLGEALPALLAAIRRVGARAKIRTGGVTADAFPPPEAVLRFLRECHRTGVLWKATAGLHHPVRGQYPLTYAPDAAKGTMYGYLNIMAAAALVQQGATDDAILRTLTCETTPHMTDAAIYFAEREWGEGDWKEMRRSAMQGFGSCSFREPLDELGVAR